jgi:hypothetical protein
MGEIGILSAFLITWSSLSCVSILFFFFRETFFGRARVNFIFFGCAFVIFRSVILIQRAQNNFFLALRLVEAGGRLGE